MIPVSSTPERPPMMQTVAKPVPLLAALLILSSSAMAQNGDSVAGRRILVLPAVGSAPETGLQLGVAVLAVFEHEGRQRRPSSMTASAVRSMKNQLRLSIDAERWSQGNDWRVAFNGSWQRFPLPYFGRGAETLESARELYTPRGVEASLTLQRRLSGPVFAVAGSRLVSTDIIQTDIGRVLSAGTLPGSRGGRSVEASIGLLMDSRDNLFSPAAGRLAQVTIARADRSIGSEFRYTRFRADVREYRSAGSHTFAVHGLIHGTTDGASFDQVALIGGSDIMRGYVKGRYRDSWMAAAQGEYRSPFIRRVGAVLFAGAGTVDSTAARLPRGRLLATYGAGLRFQLDRRQRTAARLDVARGADGASGLYIGFNQAF
jgi:outer membrane protein assembly factor BamA